MKRTTYKETPFYCGACKEKLLFMHRYYPIPGAYYVHLNHEYYCEDGRTNTATQALETGRDWAGR